MANATDPIDTHGHTVADFLALYGGVGEAAVGTEINLATSAAADDIIDTATPHGFAEGDVVVFTELTGGAGLTADTPYYVVATSLAASTFRVAATAGGSAAGFTSDITAGKVAPLSAASAEQPGVGEMSLAQSPAEVEAQIANAPAAGL